MAGIGFDLRRLMRKDTLYAVMQTYTYAGLIGSGPWVISIVAILVIGLFGAVNTSQSVIVEQFQVAISYLMAGSLILTSPLQMLFTRFVADRLYEQRGYMILPNLIGALSVTVAASASIAAIALALWFDGSFAFRLCILTSFVILSCIWIMQIFASAINPPSRLVLVFAMGYAITIAAALSLRRFGLEGLLFGFISGQAILFFLLLIMVVRQFPADRLVAFSFLQRREVFPGLALTGLLYNLGVWSDKFIFWGDELTGVAVVGPLRASPIYDFPIFLAYLSIIPGMAVFFVRMEVDVADQCHRYYQTVTQGGTYTDILNEKSSLIAVITRSLLDMLKVQTVATMVLLMFGDEVLLLFGMSLLYRPLFSIDLVAVAMQLIVVAILNFLFYMDRRKMALGLCLLFFVANTLFSWVSLNAGPQFYGYGFASAVLLTALAGAICLSSTFDRLEYETFMLQPVQSK